MSQNTEGQNRDQLRELRIDQREDLISKQVLVGDPRRWRPRWFDGRFLAAADLQSEQNYFLTRQADTARAGGSGVIDGLETELLDNGLDTTGNLRISAGQGISDTGELLVLLEDLTFNPANVPEIKRLDGAFGLQVIPSEPGFARNGIYVLALRAVEWTANEISAYPTSLTGPRTVEDGTIVEGVAVSLIPYNDSSNAETDSLRRSKIAQDIFIHGRDWGSDTGVLPLAMLSFSGNLVRWMDPFLVRRETGAERPAGMDFGFGNRALREAHLLQYENQLTDVMNLTADQPFPATQHFYALPPAGRFPAQTIDPDTLTQRFFPAGVDVELSFVPEDEVPALIEESLLLPPIDLSKSVEELAGTTVVVVVPLLRADFAAQRDALPDWDDLPPKLRPIINRPKIIQTPTQSILQIFNPRLTSPTKAPSEEASWQQLLRDALGQQLLWYIRRRHLPKAANVAATPVSATSERISAPNRLSALASSDVVIGDQLRALRSANLIEASALTSRLSAANIVRNDALVRSIVTRAANTETGKPTATSVVEALTATADPDLGKGLDTLNTEDATLGARLSTKTLADTGLLADIDLLSRDIPAAKRAEFATDLQNAVGRSGKPPATLAKKLTEIRGRLVPTRS